MIISISGKKNSGKDTVGRIIQILIAFPKTSTQNILRYLENWEEEEYIITDNTSWEIKKFAGKMVEAFYNITNVRYYELSREEKELHRPKVIEFSQSCKDLFGEFVWVNALMSEYKAIDCKCNGPGFCESPGNCEKLAIYPNWIITDTRFPNELKAVKDRDGITIRVNRPFLDHWIKKEEWDLETKGVLPHESETALDNAEFDYVIQNDGTLEELVNKVREIYNKIKI